MTPGAWYDLSARLGNVRAVVGCISSCLPCGGIPPHLMREIEDAGNLAGAAVDLLDLAVADLDRLEAELNAGGIAVPPAPTFHPV